MIKEAYCSFEVAKLLKEKGFDETCYACYEYFSSSVTMYSGWPFEYKGEPVYNSKDIITCPTHQMAMAWLREKNISIEPSIIMPHYWVYTIYEILNNKVKELYNDGGFDSYEEAVEAALKYCLENLI